MADPFIGRAFGKYRILRKIGQGGMGVVYEASQSSLNRTVAIKILPKQMALDEDFVRRFRQEGEVIAGLDHENIVRVYDVEVIDGLSCIIMEYIEGQSLHQLLETRTLDAEAVRAFGVPVARALEVAHRRGVIHRDVKSANVMVNSDGRVKLMDFGIAKAAGSGVKTITGAVLGTPEYMAPEQARSGKATVQTDVYSLGVLLYELSTGRVPFVAEDAFAVALKHVSEPPTPPREVNPEMPEWLEKTILKAMAKDPDERHRSAGEVELELLAAGEPIDPVADTAYRDPLEMTRISFARRRDGRGEPDSGVLTTAPTVLSPENSGRGPRLTRHRWGLATAIGVGLSVLAFASAFLFAAFQDASSKPRPPAVSPEVVETWVEEARHHMENGRYEEVQRLTSRAIDKGSGDQEIWQLHHAAGEGIKERRELELGQVEPPPVAGASPPPRPPPKSVEDLWREALRLKDDHHYDSLIPKLDEVLAADPEHPQAREWAEEVETWREEHQREMWGLAEEQFDDFQQAFRQRDLERLAHLFGKRQPDEAMRAYYEGLWREFPVARLRIELESLQVRDRTADFAAQVTLRVKERKSLFVAWEDRREFRWQGQMVRDWEWLHFTRPFPPTLEGAP